VAGSGFAAEEPEPGFAEGELCNDEVRLTHAE
jgi:hypothetical protein